MERRMAGNESVLALLAAASDALAPGSDPRDYMTEPGLWRSQLLPFGVTIDQAIKDGVW